MKVNYTVALWMNPRNIDGEFAVYMASEADAEIAKLKEALQWFADPRNYEDTPERVAYLKSNIVWREGIDRAKKALGL